MLLLLSISAFMLFLESIITCGVEFLNVRKSIRKQIIGLPVESVCIKHWIYMEDGVKKISPVGSDAYPGLIVEKGIVVGVGLRFLLIFDIIN